MEWTGRGLVIGVRRHGETSVILEAMVEGRGRHLGLVRGGRSARLAPTLQPGNTLLLTWRARLEDHLGHYAVELLDARAAQLIADRTRLYAIQLLGEHLRLLPERDPHDRLLSLTVAALDDGLTGLALAVALARYELFLLDELGFGLDLTACAATGESEDLTHVSPRTGRAVSRAAAEPYRDRLLRLPGFLTGPGNASPEDIRDAFVLTGHFLDMHVWMPRKLDPPPTREALIERLTAHN
ncbi:DNA repair protein RecO [Arsenicitalea aurantiaca]|uniref:DNA repair protein RecO n=1 Tax=Arsenicitalea aurantiaca TaxID=1783274 RepID=A0A433XEK2_9HYPH|nr:DNA repair protein RecO [Arsenicitalea aurantiaca]RUT32529.1 DNA repair protein RecO [Arsenicitalea aurantiaca]